MIKDIKIKLSSMRKKIIWYLDSLYLSKKENVDNKIEFLSCCNKNSRILVVAPHPDDELIGCSSVLKTFGNNADIYYTGLTGNDTTIENRRTRYAELKIVAQTLNNGLYNDFPGDSKVLNKLLMERYDYIFIPSYIDWHWEHRLVCNSIVKKILTENLDISVLLYPVTVPIPSEFVTHFCTADKEKWSTFYYAYPSQGFMPVDRFRATEKSYSSSSKTGIEAYIMMSKEELAEFEKNISIIDELSLNEIYKDINDLKKIRRISRLYYTSCVPKGCAKED